MDTKQIKSYAPKARQQFIDAIARQAALLGITEKGISPIEIKGDVALIEGKPHPAAIAQQRRGLEKLIEQQGYQQVIEKVSYSWFNRLVALRYMELHNYLDHGRRVLSHPEQENAFQILEECADIEMEGLDKAKVIQLKLAGDKDEELYRYLLLSQCHQLHQAMGFLFEAVDDASELLLPHNLTKTDSLIRQLVNAIPEEQWQNVEIIGWLYQFYISEKKDQVIGKVVKSEDIPAATQLFTPNWIVKYLVQNSIGRQWLMTYPDSPLKGQMEYYIEPAEQTAEVQAQLKAITPESIDPQTLKVLDPACGSGHILVEAYDLLKAIYAERGYRSRDIPQLILENNLYGLDIDDRAAQLAGFALLMKARADDRRIFSRNINFNVLSLQSSEHLNPLQLWNNLNLHGQWQKEQTDEMFGAAQGNLAEPQNDADFQLIADLIERFQQAKTFGSLIDVPHEKQWAIEALYQKLQELSEQGDTRQRPAANTLLPIFHQALLLSQRYDAVVANPPYMHSGAMNEALKGFAKNEYPNSKSDLFALFMERAFRLLNDTGNNAQVNMQSWMFLSSYEKLRNELVTNKSIINLMQIGYNSFPELNSKVVQCAAWVTSNKNVAGYLGAYKDLNKAPQSADKEKVFFDRDMSKTHYLDQSALENIPGTTFAYWASDRVYELFSSTEKLNDVSDLRSGISTGDNDRFYRGWFEVSSKKINFLPNKNEGGKWFPIIRGGDYRKWYGNKESVLNLENNGYEISSSGNNYRLRSEEFYSKIGITWSRITSGLLSFRVKTEDVNFGENSPCLFSEYDNKKLLAILNSNVTGYFLSLVSPTLSNQVMDVGKVPVLDCGDDVVDIVNELIRIHQMDWDEYELSWEFLASPLVVEANGSSVLSSEYSSYIDSCSSNVLKVKKLEEGLNENIIDKYELSGELQPHIPYKQVTLFSNLAYRYGSDVAEVESKNRFQSEILGDLISYSIGCMMGRYSLDREGLIYAHSGNEGFAELVEQGAYKTFPADDDGIIPLTDQEWFDDDATNRFRDFVKTVWGEAHLQENLDFVAESLCLHAIKPKRGEDSLQTIRRYLSSQFFKDHLKTYKKRPIYWLFSSGKQKAFECLVYLHRYNAGTLARMRTEYVIPLTSKINSHIEKLEQDKESTESAAEVKKIEKELQTLHKKQAELSTFDEKLRHHADQRIELDLDDGVKVNYGKFGDLLAEVKAVTGNKPGDN